MDTFADYILAEKNYIRKMEIVYLLSKKTGIYFTNSVIFKTELVKMFLDYHRVNVEDDLLITAVLLYSCKKQNIASDLQKVKYYAKEGSKYLEMLGFSKRFCKICIEANRYENTKNREPEGDILELIDNFRNVTKKRR